MYIYIYMYSFGKGGGSVWRRGLWLTKLSYDRETTLGQASCIPVRPHYYTPSEKKNHKPVE